MFLGHVACGQNSSRSESAVGVTASKSAKSRFSFLQIRFKVCSAPASRSPLPIATPKSEDGVPECRRVQFVPSVALQMPPYAPTFSFNGVARRAECFTRRNQGTPCARVSRNDSARIKFPGLHFAVEQQKVC